MTLAEVPADGEMDSFVQVSGAVSHAGPGDRGPRLGMIKTVTEDLLVWAMGDSSGEATTAGSCHG
jgi:hypothetical protein